MTKSLQYVELNKEVMNVQNQLIKSQGIIAEVINKLQLQVRIAKLILNSMIINVITKTICVQQIASFL